MVSVIRQRYEHLSDPWCRKQPVAFLPSRSSPVSNVFRLNTDSTDTWNSQEVSFYNWIVEGGDDCIAIKGNSTNIHARNSTNGAWIEAWQGKATNNTNNGDTGGGGGGFINNATYRNFRIENFGQPISITQCVYVHDPSVCDTSRLQTSNVTWENITGTSHFDVASVIHCSPLVPCPGLKFVDVNITTVNASLGKPSPPQVNLCANMIDPNAISVDATDIPCHGFAPNDMPNVLYRNWPELLSEVILSVVVPEAQRNNCLHPGWNNTAAGCDPSPY